MAEYRDIYRRAANGEGQVVSFKYTCVNPRAIVQIVHDISEHSMRYHELAVALNDSGFYVCGNDLIGHGMSKQGHQGCFGMKKNCYEGLLSDIDSLFNEVSAEVGGTVPRIIIGAGFGAMLSELYTIKYGNISMIISMENLEIPAALSLIKLNANNHIKRKGFNSVSESVHNTMYQMGKPAGSPPYNEFFWISSDEEELKKYVDDEDCGFMLTASAYREIISVIEQLRGKDGIVRLPDIPIYILAGSEDQRGNCGNSVMRIANMLSAKGHNEVSYKLYKDCYHDILHDICKKQVIKDILGWIEHKLNK
ncbi:serine aminopeptidase domain-containing protein [Mogibacterium diversum]|uniref:serine aminopeptidase domain-containing protein n=1 Tax=Mogibacterium diversum TaxID=114527 RepID=UPI0028D1DA7B|nr:alpha/beta hydrolase [Mogibacterium diversum]